MEKVEFKIKFITPLLIHGASSRQVDDVGLTGKALRGCWRFWFRAMVGGMVKNIDKDKKRLLGLEDEVFGSSDEEVGTKFRMLVEPINFLESDSTFIKFSWGKVPFKGFKEDSAFSVRIIPRKSLSDEELKILLATIWLWANLGAIGQRARRGFGSPVIVTTQDNNPFQKYFGNSELPIRQVFDKIATENGVTIEDHLEKGIKIAWDTFKSWEELKKKGSLNPDDIYDKNSQEPSNAPFFILQSFKQIAVCAKFYPDLIDTLQEVHGINKCSDLGWANPGRMASPVFLRLHKEKDSKGAEAFVPSYVWCKQENVPDTGCASNYLKSIGFKKNLFEFFNKDKP